jgi:HSP20 family protein
MDALRREVDRVFEGFGGGRFRTAFLPGRSARGYPRINVRDEGEAIRVEALAPGIDPDTLNVAVKGDTLTLSGEKRPAADVPAKVEARYENGILTVKLGKAEKAKPRKIAVSFQ